MPPRDLCRGFRECYAAVLKAVVASPIVAGFAMGIPVYFLLSALLWQGSIIQFMPEFVYVQNNASAPFYTILGFTIFAWLLELIGMKWTLPNLLGICAFCHSAIGSWWLVNFIILFFAGWSYVPLRLMTILLLSVITPAIIWHITGDILRAYKRKLIDEIASHHRGLAAAGEQFMPGGDLETGQSK